jgi:hypothetical protein
MKNASRRGLFPAAVLAAISLLCVPDSGYAQAAAGDNATRVNSATMPLASGAAMHGASRSILDRASEALAAAHRGPSGRVRVVLKHAGQPLRLLDVLPTGVRPLFLPLDGSTRQPVETLPDRPGAWTVLLHSDGVSREARDIIVMTTVPITAKRNGRIGDYNVGTWPFEKQRAPGSSTYAPPVGLIEVTQQNRNLYVSEHFRLGDLLTKGQDAVWPKYIALAVTLLDKAELTLAELEKMGHHVQHAGVISAFRSPQYNANGGDTSGRGDLSRHMYGDALDLYIDNDRNGRMDDLNRDGRVDRKDAMVVATAAERVEKAHPELIGGIGIYNPKPGAHSGFVHLDTRGTKARW